MAKRIQMRKNRFMALQKVAEQKKTIEATGHPGQLGLGHGPPGKSWIGRLGKYSEIALKQYPIFHCFHHMCHGFLRVFHAFHHMFHGFHHIFHGFHMFHVSVQVTGRCLTARTEGMQATATVTIVIMAAIMHHMGITARWWTIICPSKQ
jgi:hypothetical protein